jgi:phenylacetate-CoA ligase
MSAYAELKARHCQDLFARLPEMIAHIGWSQAQLRVERHLVEAHLHGLREDAYLLDRYHAFASGGSSGRRGVFVYGWDARANCAAGILRWRVSWQRSLGLDRLVMASVSAGHATHMTSAMMATFSSPRLALHRFPVTQPLSEIVEGFNALQPDVLHGYPTVMRLLALEARAGRLRIPPRRIAVGSEPLLPGTRQLLAETGG